MIRRTLERLGRIVSPALRRRAAEDLRATMPEPNLMQQVARKLVSLIPTADDTPVTLRPRHVTRWRARTRYQQRRRALVAMQYASRRRNRTA